MHAYLIITKSQEKLESEINKLAKENNSEIIEFSVQKIDDARNLNSFLKLSASNKILIVIKDFQNATEECANALLKNLEEPQKNVIFAIQASNENVVLPTIKSRCKIISLYSKNKEVDVVELEKFIKMATFEKFNFLEGKKTREEALYFTDSMLSYLENRILKDSNALQSARYASLTIKLKKSLEANGNVKLHILRYLSHICN